MSKEKETVDSIFMQAEEKSHPGRVYKMEEPEIVINDPVAINYDEAVNVGTPGHIDHNAPQTEPTMKDLVLIEVQRLITISKSYDEQIKTAKTKTKKDFYSKKLHKNNKILADMIMRLERLNQIENNKNDEPTDEPTQP
jgi:hypothetical protein